MVMSPSQNYLSTVTTSSLNLSENFGAEAAMKAIPSVNWSPSQAAEFVVWYKGKNVKNAGLQLAPMINGWTGTDVGEFLTRVYLAERQEDGSVSYESRNVRKPNWYGLKTKEGVDKLTKLLKGALPLSALEPGEIAKCAEVFLLRYHSWPSESKVIETEGDSFAGLGHAKSLGQAMGRARRARLGDFTYQDVVAMLSAKTTASNDRVYMQLNDFYSNLGFKLSASDSVHVVQGMAKAGWEPALIANLICDLEMDDDDDDDDDELPSIDEVTTAEVEAAMKEQSKAIAEEKLLNGPEIEENDDSIIQFESRKGKKARKEKGAPMPAETIPKTVNANSKSSLS